MEHKETLTPETEVVSAQGESPKDVTQNNFTEDEKALAEKYGVEPKTCRLISEIVSVHTEGINKLIGLMRGKKEQQAEPEQAETQEQPDLDIADLGIQRLKRWLLSRDLNAKIAVCLVRTLQQGDSGMSSLIDEVNWQYEDDLAELLKNPPENLSDEDNYNIGICLASQMWEKYSMGRAEYKAKSIN